MRCATHMDEDVRVYIARSVCVIAVTLLMAQKW